MSANVDRLIGMLEHTCVFQPRDISTLNELLSQAHAEEIPDNLREDVVDVIDLMYMCGNVYSGAGAKIDSLHDSLQNIQHG